MSMIGVDIGGMSIKIGLVKEDGTLENIIKVSINKEASTQEQLASLLLSLCDQQRQEAIRRGESIEGIGFGFPGTVDNLKGEVRYTANISGFNGFKLREYFVKHFDRSLTYALCNDADAAAIAEANFGSGKESRYFILITLGTGVGGGIVMDKQLYLGQGAVAIEVGHMCIERDGELCGCGLKGCFEAYASATALIRQTQAAILAHPHSLLAEIPSDKVNGATAFKMAKKGCPVAQEVVDDYIESLAIGISNLIVLFQPDAIAIGGGVSHEGENLLQRLQMQLPQHLFADKLQKTKIVLASLGNDAGIVGAACMVKTRQK